MEQLAQRPMAMRKISVANTGAAGDAAISKVEFDVRGSLIPDATFDPLGTAGDTTKSCLAVSSGAAATGFVVPADPCVDPFSLPHEDSPGTAGNGNDGMALNFNGFEPGETIVFGVDVDPTTIQGVVGSGGAGAVSGLELTGSTVTVTFSDGSVRTNQLFGDGSQGGAQALVSSSAGLVTPAGIEMVGVSTTQTVFPNGSLMGLVPAAGAQTVRVSGPVGASVKLLAVTGDLVTSPAFDVDPFESDAAVRGELPVRNHRDCWPRGLCGECHQPGCPLPLRRHDRRRCQWPTDLTTRDRRRRCAGCCGAPPRQLRWTRGGGY